MNEMVLDCVRHATVIIQECAQQFIPQERIEPPKAAREHVTTINSEIQTWRPDATFIWKGSSTSMQTSQSLGAGRCMA